MATDRTAAGQRIRKFTTLCDAAFRDRLAAHGFKRVERFVSAYVCSHVYRSQNRYIKVTVSTHVLDGASTCRLLLGEGPHTWPDWDWNSVSLSFLGHTAEPRRTREHYLLRDVAELGDVLRRMAADVDRKAADFLRGDIRRLRASRSALARSRQAYSIYSPQANGGYIGKVDPRSEALRLRYAAECADDGSSARDA